MYKDIRKRIEYARKWRAEHQNYMKGWYLANKKKQIKAAMDWQKKNSDKKKAYGRAWAREWQRRDPEGKYEYYRLQRMNSKKKVREE